MNRLLKPGGIAGIITAPPSKSHMQRILACALIQGQPVELKNASHSEDCLAVLEVIRQLGGTLEWQNDTVLVHPPAPEHWLNDGSPVEISFGESGLAARMLTPVLAMSRRKFLLKPAGSLRFRPMEPLLSLLDQWQIGYEADGIFLPVSIQGPANIQETFLDGSSSSQYLTGAILAAALSGKAVSLSVSGLKSRPYVEMTIATMELMGLRTPQWTADDRFIFDGGGHRQPPDNISVEGDWSGAAFLLVAAAVGGVVVVRGLDAFSTQADKRVLNALQEAGVAMSIRETEVEIYSTPRLRPFHFNANDCPDLFPPLAALACFCEGKSVIEGINRLLHKESNRAETIQAQLQRLGQSVTLQDDYMIIDGMHPVTPQTVDSCHDHRIAMMLAVVALRSPENISLENAGAIRKSYPSFFEDMDKISTV